MGIHREPYLHPPEDPRYWNLITRSSDQGKTWSQPRIAPNFDWYGVETPGIVQLANGDVLLNQWRFLWYPLELAQKIWQRGERDIYVADPSGRNWRMVESEADWEGHPFPWARGNAGAFVHISTDNGHTFELTVPVDVAPYQSPFSPKGAIELTNGDLLLALGSHDYDPLHASFIVRSQDKGRSWHPPVETTRIPGKIFSEPTIVECSSGKLLLFSREEKEGFIHLSQSTDGGSLWSTRVLDLWGYPVHAIRLQDGRILIVYGHRKAPYGIRAAVSGDEGETWSQEIVIRHDLPNDNQAFNLGYPSVIEYAPGKLFTAYYGEDGNDVTCIQGTYFEV